MGDGGCGCGGKCGCASSRAGDRVRTSLAAETFASLGFPGQHASDEDVQARAPAIGELKGRIEALRKELREGRRPSLDEGDVARGREIVARACAARKQPAKSGPPGVSASLARLRGRPSLPSAGVPGAPPPVAVPSDETPVPDVEVPESGGPIGPAMAYKENTYLYRAWFSAAERARLKTDEATRAACQELGSPATAETLADFFPAGRPAPLTGSGTTTDPCDPLYDREGYLSFCATVDADLWSATVAIAELDGQDALWHSHMWEMLTDHFTDKAISNTTADKMLQDSTSYGWDDWKDTAIGYSPRMDPSRFAQPRRRVMRAALQYITGLQRGIPESWGSLGNVRAPIIDPIEKGDMRYRLYGPDIDPAQTLENLWVLLTTLLAWDINELLLGLAYVLWEIQNATGAEMPDEELLALFDEVEVALVELFVAPARCGECPGQRFDHPPEMSRVARGSSSSASSSRDSDCANEPAFGCPCDDLTTDLRDLVPFEFEFDCDSGTDIPAGANHGFLTRRVWFCAIMVDRWALMFDWFEGQATRHLAMARRNFARGTARGEVAAMRDLAACRTCLQMAASCAADLAGLVVHETAHNVSLYHCYDPVLSKPIDGFQDAARWSWWVLAAAKLGITRVEHSRGWSGVNWYDPMCHLNQPLAFKRVGGWTGEEWGDGRLRGGVVEIRDTVGDSEATSAGFGAELLSFVGAISSYLLALTTDYVMAGFVMRLSFWLSESIDRDLLRREGATNGPLSFAVALPLVPGGGVLSCCIDIDDADCTSHPGPRACWSSNPPDEAEGCCVQSTGLGGGSPGTQGCPGIQPGSPGGDVGIPPLDFGYTRTLIW